ncbi:MAG: hypothetical protein K0R66_1314 [Gammaproteobacteria bacterium]|jgi:hypothetical protein|nr:hypothetical protein [Gammaproteobacteria bacterium]
MNSYGQTIKNILAVYAACSATVGYFILNYAARERVGTPLAISAAIVSGSLNAIFHSLPVQRAALPKSCAATLGLVACMVVAILSTGYIYASSEESVKQAVSENESLGMAIALSYQASYFLPIGFTLNEMAANLPVAPFLSKTRAICRRTKLNDAEHQPKSISPLSEALLSNDESQNEAQEKIIIVKPRSCARNLILNLIAYGLGMTLIYVSASAAYQLFKQNENPSVIAKLYKPIYSESVLASIAAHSPQLLLTAKPAKEGIVSAVICILDMYHEPNGKKYAGFALTLGILALSALSTYLIAGYGQVALPVLSLAMICAILDNYEPGVKCSEAMVNLANGQGKGARDSVLDGANVTSFFKASKAHAGSVVGSDSGSTADSGMVSVEMAEKA